ncbi:hypothetical protein ACN3XK_55875 [Actinomadura welshii]
MSNEPAVGVVEFNRRIQCAVWGLAVTMALSGWSVVPWVVVDDRPYVLWEFAVMVRLGWLPALVPTVMSVTIVLGAAASAAASRPVARAAWVAGLVTALLCFCFVFDIGYEHEVGDGPYYASAIAVVFAVVFMLISRSAPHPPPVAYLPRTVVPSQIDRVSEWMDPSFGTIDKRYFRDR